MSETSGDGLRRTLVFAAIVESATGLALMIEPAIVVRLLLGSDIDGTGTLLGRCFGITLLSLGVACWPRRSRMEDGVQAFRAMLAYNALIALFLAYLGFVAHVGGVLLWPGVALHAAVALLLVRLWSKERRSNA